MGRGYNLTRDRVRDAGDALAYLTDCTLATVDDLCMKKSASKYERNRQISIAQTSIDWIKQMKIEPSGRGAEVIEKFDGSVQKYADAVMARHLK